MTYEAMLGRLFAARRLGVDLDLGRVAAAFTTLGRPDERLGLVVHVAGTNGKGSTAAMIAACLGAAGLRVGLFTSPHLCRFSERVRVGGAELPSAELAALYPEVEAAGGELTFFEQATLLGVLAFARAEVEATVLEVGLGGRLDATNAVASDVAVVTGVAFDHQEILGGDLASIAREKGGIFKAGRPAVIGASGLAEGVAPLVAAARAAGSTPIVVVDPDIELATPLGLRGPHQRRNAACALAALDSVGEILGRPLPPAALRRGLAEVRWPGRLEVVDDGAGRVVLDGAHNPQGAAALAAALPEVRRGRLVAVASVSAEKDAAGVIGPVAALADEVILTQAPSPRARAAAELLAVAGVAASVEPDWRQAVAHARRHAGEGGTVVVFGSLFLVGPARAALLGEPVDPLVVQDPPPKPSRA